MDERPPLTSTTKVAGHLFGGSTFAFAVLLWIGFNWRFLDWQPGTGDGAPHGLNWSLGWLLLWASIVAGAAYGLFGGDEVETAPRRRAIWLGLGSTGIMGAVNVLFGLASFPPPLTPAGAISALCFLLSGLLLPTVCFLSAWRSWAKFLLIIPIFTLSLGVFATVRGNVEDPNAGLFDALMRE